MELAVGTGNRQVYLQNISILENNHNSQSLLKSKSTRFYNWLSKRKGLIVLSSANLLIIQMSSIHQNSTGTQVINSSGYVVLLLWDILFCSVWVLELKFLEQQLDVNENRECWYSFTTVTNEVLFKFK